MKIIDLIRFSTFSVLSHKLRTLLILFSMSIGVAAVTVLTALGAGAKNYIINEFSALGTHLLIVLPGRVETSGFAASMVIGKTPRDLTLNDARALLQSPTIRRIAPISVGAATVSWKQKEREVAILGSTHELLPIRHWEMHTGQFLPVLDIDESSPVCVIGSTVRDELFATTYPIGQWLRISDYRCRVIGVLASEGHSVGVNTDELVIVPVASALSMFNSPSLFRILVEAKSREQIPIAGEAIIEIIKKRHHNKLDVTVITQDAVLGTFDEILGAITMGVTGIAAISLVVAGLLIMNVMLITVSQRTHEIGLLKALGAKNHTIRILFTYEAILLSTTGGVLGIGIGYLGSWAIRYLYPTFEISPPGWAILLAMLTAIVTGLFFGTLPAHKASRLQPVIALARR
ncbi:MAG: ABC transporter permease [Thioalkalispiraceae bacterium]|jgi:putative ABC transport system permease protein